MRLTYTGLFCFVLLFCMRTGAEGDSTEKRLQDALIWTGQTEPSAPHYVAFRRRFSLSGSMERAYLHLFADSRYLLWINGTYVQRGPCRFDPKAPEYDTMEVTDALQRGENTLAVLVLAGASNGRMMRHAPGLTAQLVVTRKTEPPYRLQTDSTWRWSEQTQYMPPKVQWGTVLDRNDARRESSDWTQPGFEETAWQTAKPVAGNTWGSLAARRIPLLQEISCIPTPIAGSVLPQERTDGQEILFDIGRMVQGYVVAEMEADAGTRLEFEFAERYVQGKLADSYGCVNQYVARAGRQTYLSADTFGCHYVRVRVVAGRAKLLSLKMVDRRYPYVEAGSFRCSDPLLNTLWERAVQTLRMCSEDAYTDCALRERTEWMGDGAVVEYPLSRVVFAEPTTNGRTTPRSASGLIINMLRHIAQSQQADGRLKAHHPSDRWDIHGYIEDYACLWVQSLRQVYDQTGDAALVRELWKPLERQMQWFLERRTERGLVLAREFVIFDNPLKYKTCEGATLNAFVYRALLDAAYLADCLGEKPRANEYRAAAAALNRSFQANLWDESAGTYRAGIFDGSPLEPTVHAALLSLNRGLVPPERRKRVTDWLLAHATGKDGVGMPYTQFWMFEELYRLDAPEHDTAALQTMRTRWADVLARTDTGTLTESFNGGEACHNFGAVPAYFLSTYVLGVRQEEPTRRRHLVIEPRPGDLTMAEGRVVTPFGVVPIRWEKANDRFRCSVTIPPGVTAALRLPASVGMETLVVDGVTRRDRRREGDYFAVRLAAGRHEVTLAR